MIRIVQEPATTDQPPNALGLAMPNIGQGNRGAVFLKRIQEKVRASGGQITLPTLLGCVIAHEIGHLLLRTTSHTSEGIMRADFGKPDMVAKAVQRRLIFTAADRLRFAGSVPADVTEAKAGAERSPW
jgi:hypothetical protein